MLTVVQVAWPTARVGSDAFGRAEQVVAWLDEALVADGHRSIVVAVEGSCVRGELVAVPPPAGPLERALPGVHARVRAELERILAREVPDLVHLHGVDWPAYAPEGGPPVLVTLHHAAAFYPPRAFDRAGVTLQC